MKKTWNLIVGNWQTSLAGAIVIGVKIAESCGRIPAGIADDLIGLAAGTGLLVATDARTPAQQTIAKTELELAQAALAAAKTTGDTTLIKIAQAAVDALMNSTATGVMATATPATNAA